MLGSFYKENKKLLILNLTLSFITALIIKYFIVNTSSLMRSGDYLFLEILNWVPSLLYSIIDFLFDIPIMMPGLIMMTFLKLLSAVIITAQLFILGIMLTFIIKKIIAISKKEINFKIIGIIILVTFYLPLSIYSATYMSMSESGDKRLDPCFSSTSLTKYVECTKHISWYYITNQDDSIYNKKILSLCDGIPKDPFPESMLENPNTRSWANQTNFDKQDLCYSSMAIHLNKYTSFNISKDDQIFLCKQTKNRDLCLLKLAEFNRFRNSMHLCETIENQAIKTQCSTFIKKQVDWRCDTIKNETEKNECVSLFTFRQN